MLKAFAVVGVIAIIVFLGSMSGYVFVVVESAWGFVPAVLSGPMMGGMIIAIWLLILYGILKDKLRRTL